MGARTTRRDDVARPEEISLPRYAGARTAWQAAAGATVVALVALVLGGPLGWILFLALQLATAALFVDAARRRPRPDAMPLVLTALALALAAPLGPRSITGWEPDLPLAVQVALHTLRAASGVAGVAAIGFLVRRRLPGDRSGWLDAATAAVALALLLWASLDWLAAETSDWPSALFAFGSSVGFALLLRLLLTGGVRQTSLMILVGSYVLMLLGSIAATAAAATPALPPLLADVLGVLARSVLPAAALHPTVRYLTDRVPPPRRLGAGRLALLAVSSLVPAVVLVVREAGGSGASAYPVAVAVALLTGLVLTRMTDLLQRINDQAEELERLSATDSLTGTSNRRAWSAALTAETRRALRGGRPLSVAFLDLDDFKSFNDTYGHAAGDRLLIDAVRAWGAELRETDVFARIGGDEFGILLPDCSAHDAIELANRLRLGVPRERSCSVGVATWDGAESIDELLARADTALYAAKDGGRDLAVLEPPPRAASHDGQRAGTTHRR